MIIGVPKEAPLGRGMEERRVGLSPAGVAELVEQGAKVLVEREAGAGAHFSNLAYERAGAQIVLSHEEIFRRADLICKVGRVSDEEWHFLKEGQIVTGFLHLITASKLVLKGLVDRKITSIAYELIEEPDGRLPVLNPTSEIAGKMVPQLAGRLLERGRGTLLGGIPGIPPADVVILGGGTLGYHAARALRGVGATVYILEKRARRLEKLDKYFDGSIVTAVATRANIEKYVRFADVLVGAVLESGGRSPVLVTREMVRSMEPGSVILDFSIDRGGCIETSRLTPSEEYAYLEEGIWHFCMPNASSLVARTATHALTNAALPYLKNLVKHGLDESLKFMPELTHGICTHLGAITQKHLAREHALEYHALERQL